MKYPDDFINKVICGDCIEVMKEIPDNSVDLVFTSPPFKDEDIGLGCNNSDNRITLPENREKYLDWLEEVMIEFKRVSKIILMFNSSRRLVDICKRFNPERVLIWNKKRTCSPFRYEPIFLWNYGDEKINKYIWNDCFSYLPILNQKSPFENPKVLYYNILKMFKGVNLVLDPFGGSGTTAISCKELHKSCILIEKEEERCKIARKRLEQEHLRGWMR